MTPRSRRLLSAATATATTFALLAMPAARAATGPAVPTGHNPFGHLDQVKGTKGGINVSGWAADPDKLTQPLLIHASIDRKYSLAFHSGVARPDVQAIWHTGPHQGFAFRLKLAPGPHYICVAAVNIGPGVNTLLGCATATVK